MFANFDLGVFLLAVLPVLLAITVREVARGYTARYWGDHTGEQLGRLTPQSAAAHRPCRYDCRAAGVSDDRQFFYSAGRAPCPSIRAISAIRAVRGVGCRFQVRLPI